MEQSVREGFRSSVECYETVTTKKEKITVTNKGQVKYGLFPVWFLNTKWNGKTYSFAMNGQTGHLIGDLPVGKTLAVKYWFKHHIPLTLIKRFVTQRQPGNGFACSFLCSYRYVRRFIDR